jgi:hypothetical protein
VTTQEYRAENPGLDHVPDSEVEKLLAYQGWRYNRAMDRAGRYIVEAAGTVLLKIRRLFRG